MARSKVGAGNRTGKCLENYNPAPFFLFCHILQIITSVVHTSLSASDSYFEATGVHPRVKSLRHQPVSQSHSMSSYEEFIFRRVKFTQLFNENVKMTSTRSGGAPGRSNMMMR